MASSLFSLFIVVNG